MKLLGLDYIKVKKSFTLIEVLISVGLLSVIIAIVFQVQQNNLFYLSKFKTSITNNQYLTLATQYNSKDNKLQNRKIYLDKIVDFKDDDIRKELKNIKIELKEDEKDTIDLSTDQYPLIINVIEQKYILNDQIEKKLYKFGLK